jgi:two-component system LytT family sensor kinase
VLTGVIVIVVALALVAAAVLAGRWLRRRMLDPPGVRSAAQALWTAGLAAPPLREGLTPRSVGQALPYLLALLETPGWRSAGRMAWCWVLTAPADTMPTRSPTP